MDLSQPQHVVSLRARGPGVGYVQGGMYNTCKSATPGLDVQLLATVLTGDIMFCRIELYAGENFWRKINIQGLLCLSLPSGVPSLLPVGLHAWQGSFACGPAGDCQCTSNIVRFLAAYFVSQLYSLSVHFEKCSVYSVKRLKIPADEAWPCLLKWGLEMRIQEGFSEIFCYHLKSESLNRRFNSIKGMFFHFKLINLCSL